MQKNTLARSIAAMLVLRKRKAYKAWLAAEHSGVNDTFCQVLYEAFREASIAVSEAKTILED